LKLILLSFEKPICYYKPELLIRHFFLRSSCISFAVDGHKTEDVTAS